MLSDKKTVMNRIHRLITRHRGTKEVTLPYIIESLDLGCSQRTLQRRFREWKVKWVRPKSKPELTPSDVVESFEFARRFLNKPRAFYTNTVHCYIDCKWFKINTTETAKHLNTRSRVRGVYKIPNKDPNLKCYTKPSKSLKTGARSICVAGAIGRGRVLAFKPVQKWNGKTAAEFYKFLAKKVRSTFGMRLQDKVIIVEDNDPSGFNSNAGKLAKQTANIQVIKLPKRRPDLNPLDYSFWNDVNERVEEANVGKKSESRQSYINRLVRLAYRTDRQYITRTIGDMKRRISCLYRVKGRHFSE